MPIVSMQRGLKGTTLFMDIQKKGTFVSMQRGLKGSEPTGSKRFLLFVSMQRGLKGKQPNDGPQCGNVVSMQRGLKGREFWLFCLVEMVESLNAKRIESLSFLV